MGGVSRGSGGMRSGVLSLNIRERTALYAAYIPWVEGGGIFIPTTRNYALADEVFMLLTLMDDPNRIAVQGKVVWITPPGIQGARAQGIGVQFTKDDTGRAAKGRIEAILGALLASSRPTHTM
ncbi:MAG TPA: PilZ domain-containing protein [Casimicrobium sp.]|nr:PilZ domain-containing protein [Casimicrobium sp.]HPG60935.1 PilZ domain-containing protein [Casimicrobium sp.]HPT55340.1 PilZ domain-containing protein [Casimicrobium sp.]HPV23698.1 PilZ domain-containing protein [Casimicrobium sp.]